MAVGVFVAVEGGWSWRCCGGGLQSVARCRNDHQWTSEAICDGVGCSGGRM
ncbi:hypothetical protein DPMN_099220 [Dreissena polymorpha]|uniref:Uncharacterized protein n=1 Tax=Dreissena polymorpha TaxID=45954 RepID=A0A9D4LDR2_DREPO|nr:hypothetical protein DPMN_099220 [Dreissena polymorpha]